MAITEAYAGTQTTAIGTFTVTIASPAVFTRTGHELQADDTIVPTTTGALPTGLTAGTTYYVISAGLTANDFQVSTTKGGSAVNTSGTQSGTHSLTAEQTLNTTTPETTDGIYQVFIDCDAMAVGDAVEIRIKEKVGAATTQRTIMAATFAHDPSADDPLWVSPSFVLLHGWDVTIRQSAGTARAFPFSVRKVA